MGGFPEWSNYLKAKTTYERAIKKGNLSSRRFPRDGDRAGPYLRKAVSREFPFFKDSLYLPQSILSWYDGSRHFDGRLRHCFGITIGLHSALASTLAALLLSIVHFT